MDFFARRTVFIQLLLGFLFVRWKAERASESTVCVKKHNRASECRENKIEKLCCGVSRIAAVGRAKGGKLCVQRHGFCVERHGLYR